MLQSPHRHTAYTTSAYSATAVSCGIRCLRSHTEASRRGGVGINGRSNVGVNGARSGVGALVVFTTTSSTSIAGLGTDLGGASVFAPLVVPLTPTVDLVEVPFPADDEALTLRTAYQPTSLRVVTKGHVKTADMAASPSMNRGIDSPFVSPLHSAEINPPGNPFDAKYSPHISDDEPLGESVEASAVGSPFDADIASHRLLGAEEVVDRGLLPTNASAEPESIGLQIDRSFIAQRNVDSQASLRAESSQVATMETDHSSKWQSEAFMLIPTVLRALDRGSDSTVTENQQSNVDCGNELAIESIMRILFSDISKFRQDGNVVQRTESMNLDLYAAASALAS